MSFCLYWRGGLAARGCQQGAPLFNASIFHGYHHSFSWIAATGQLFWNYEGARDLLGWAVKCLCSRMQTVAMQGKESAAVGEQKSPEQLIFLGYHSMEAKASHCLELNSSAYPWMVERLSVFAFGWRGGRNMHGRNSNLVGLLFKRTCIIAPARILVCICLGKAGKATRWGLSPRERSHKLGMGWFESFLDWPKVLASQQSGVFYP